jgi:iron complex transport system ATP-binding protein
MSLLRERVKESSSAALICLHEPSLALQFCDRLIVMDEGKCIAQLDPKNDSIEKMETYLSRVYGEIKLYKIDDKLVMLPR